MYMRKLTYGSPRSALMHLCRGCGATMPYTFQNELAKLIYEGNETEGDETERESWDKSR